MKILKLTFLVCVLLGCIYTILSSLLALNIRYHVKLAKITKSDYVEYEGESFKNIESLQVSILQKQYLKLFIDYFLNFPILALQIVILFTMVVFGGCLKTIYSLFCSY